jgi:oxygen-independent coproporphyrinogen-3 oxidase
LPEHLYVHVPLCRSKCPYCDFYSLVEDGTVSPSDVVTATLLTAVDWTRKDLGVKRLETLYIGGGTPTMLGRHLPLLVGELKNLFGFAPGAEVTVEANPDSLDLQLIALLAEAGVTRISLGVQSLSDGALVWLGRPHDAEGAIDAMLAVAAAGLDLSVDLMCGMPSVPDPLWRAVLASVVECGAEHVSVYPLSVEAGTPLAGMVACGEYELPDPDAVADEMLVAAEVLGGLGLQRYETANYAVPGHESRHNTAYWTGRPYLGIGAGAHGMLSGEQARAVGLVGEDAVARARYAYQPGRDARAVSLETLSEAETLREDAMLGLRMTAGIENALAERAGVVEALESLASDGLVVREGERWRATERGWLLGNEVFGRVWEAE